MEINDSWKPLFQRLSTWKTIYVLVAIFVLSMFLGRVIFNIYFWFETEEAVATVVSKKHWVKYNIDKWTTIRAYNRSSAPECSWDKERDLVCVERDTSEMCIRRDWEYDYSYRDWRTFKKIEDICEDELCHIPKFGLNEGWTISWKEEWFYVTLIYGGRIRELEIDNFNLYHVNDKVKVKVWKSNNKIKKIVQ